MRRQALRASLGRHGYFGIVAAFVFISVLVLAILLALALSGQVTTIKSYAGEQQLRAAVARETYARIAACNRQQLLAEENLPRCLDATSAATVALVQPERFGCAAKAWVDDAALANAGLTLDDLPAGERYVYWLGVRQEANGAVCLAQLIIVL